jgi:predicted RNA binding protein YcfA (HicA-like mRNA interferase family)
MLFSFIWIPLWKKRLPARKHKCWMKPKELIKLLQIEGFVFVLHSGSQAIYRKTDFKIIVVPIHSKDIPTGTLNSILNDAVLKAV